ncbi:MAG TPA: DUF1501 domain-containing protein [Rugosimonospora sp.]|nr:DUF1501 domain-containing protein [Rugosimonospora sp.]
MDPLTRRRFLVRSGVVAGAALAAGAGAYTLADVLRTASWQDRPPQARTLVLVTLYGGNDGLNTVIPYADPAYHDARPELAYQPGEVLHLDAQLGLNPGLKGFARLYAGKRLAIVRGVQYPQPDHSHFRSMDIWQTGSPQAPASTGWLGRWLDVTGHSPLHAVSFEPVLPVALAGAGTAGASVTTGGGKVAVPAGLAAPAPGEPALQARAARAYADLIAATAMVDHLPAPAAPAANETALDRQLDLVARCVEAGVATRVFSVSLGGFDTHADEKATQQRLLTQLDTAITGFTERMAGTANGQRVVTAIYSEFGRRVRANASSGTDHGTASDVFLLGTPVAGGLYGTQPSLTDLDNGDLKVHADFRDVYAMLLRDVLDTEPDRVLAGWTTRLARVLAGG